MVQYILSIKADVEGVASLQWKSDQKLVCCDVRHPVDPSDTKEKIVVDFSELEVEAEEKHLPKHHEKPCHFHVTWSDGTKGTIRVVDDKRNAAATSSATMATQEWFPLLVLECENVEPTKFHPLGTEFIVTNNQGTVYKEVDLSSGDWTEYDLSSGSTSITNLESKFE